MRAWPRILRRLGDLTAFACTLIVGIAVGCALTLGEAAREARELERVDARDHRTIDR